MAVCCGGCVGVFEVECCDGDVRLCCDCWVVMVCPFVMAYQVSVYMHVCVSIITNPSGACACWLYDLNCIDDNFLFRWTSEQETSFFLLSFFSFFFLSFLG